MSNVVLTLILLVNGAILAGLILAFVKIRRLKADVISFVTPPLEGQPSPLAETIASMGDVLARSMMAQLKATFMGMESGAARSAKAEAAGQAFEAIGGANPFLGNLLSGSPMLKKLVKNNPGIVQAALSKFMGGSQPVTAGGNHSSQNVFKI